MTGRQLKTIFAVLTLLAAVYVATGFFGRSGSGRVGPDIGAAITPQLEGLVVTGPGAADSVVLRKSGDGWTVNGYPADTARVREALADMAAASPGRLVARSSANHIRLGVSTDSASRVRLISAESATFEFLLGGGGTDGRYVRLPDSDEVYTVPATAVQALSRSVDDWRSRLIAVLDTAAVTRILMSRIDDERTVALTRQATDSAAVWLEGSVAADAGVVGSLLEAASELEASGFPSDSVALETDFSRPSATLEFYESDEPGAAPRLSLRFLAAPDARDFLVRRADTPLPYRISAGQARRLLPTRAMLFTNDE